MAEDGAAGRSKGSRVLVTVGVAVTVTLAAAGFALGRNVSASRAQTHPGSAWLSTTADGSVNLVDGVSGGSAAKVPVPGASGHSMDVTQNGDLVFVRDTVTGAITVIDTSQLVATVQIPHSKDTTVLAGGGVAYLVDAIAGTVQKVDPATLAPVGAQVHLPGSLGTPIVDHDGVLWAPVTAQGSVIAVTGDTQAAPIAVDPNGSDMVMALAGGTPTVVDRTAGTLTAITDGVAGQVIKLPGAANSGTGLQVASVDSNQPLPLVESGPTAQLVLVNLASGIPTSIGIPAGYTADDLRPPLQAGQRTYIPDFTRGSVLVYDGTTNRFGTPVPVLAHGGSFQSEIVDGIVYFNDPSSGTAVSVSTDGAVHTITKNGSTIPTAGPSTTEANPNPTQPPTTQPSSQNHDTSAPPVTETSTTNQPSAPPTTKPVVPTNPIGPPSNSVPVPASTSSSSLTPTPTTSAPPTKQPAPPPSTTTTSTRPPPPSTTSTPKPVAPQAPQTVTVTPTKGNDGSVTVTWQNPSNTANIASYTVSVSPKGGTQTANSALSVNYTKLACGTNYSFTVTAVGPTGLTTSASPVASRSCYSPGAPQNINTTTKPGNATGMQVTWGAPSNPGIGTLKYIVSLSGPSAPAAQTVSGTSATISSLVPGHAYTVSVRAETKGGTSGATSKPNQVAGYASKHAVNLTAFKKFYEGGDFNTISCTFPKCPTWIQATPSSYSDSAGHGDTVATVQNGATLSGYCYSAGGYRTRTDDFVVSTNWIYVNANGTFGYASSLWFGGSGGTFGLAACPSGLPTG